MEKWELPLNSESSAPKGLLELPATDLTNWLKERGQSPLRAKQLRRWIVASRAVSFEQMTDLPLGLREELAAEFKPLGTVVVRHLKSIDGTEKLLLRLADDQLVECVLMR